MESKKHFLNRVIEKIGVEFNLIQEGETNDLLYPILMRGCGWVIVGIGYPDEDGVYAPSQIRKIKNNYSERYLLNKLTRLDYFRKVDAIWDEIILLSSSERNNLYSEADANKKRAQAQYERTMKRCESFRLEAERYGRICNYFLWIQDNYTKEEFIEWVRREVI